MTFLLSRCETARMNARLESLLNRYVADGTLPGAVAAITVDGDPLRPVAVGSMSPGGEPMRDDAIFRILSMTKPITAVAALRLVDEGRIGLDEPVLAWLPELADRRVLVSPGARLDETVPAPRSITLRHLLTNTSGYGSILDDSPLAQAMAANGTDDGPEPVSVGADEWLARLSELPLAFAPGEGWRYHHSFGILGVLLSRLTGRPLGDHLRDELFAPLGMDDTGFRVVDADLPRLPPAYRHDGSGLAETEPAGGGFYAGPAAFDVSHGELVSTLADYHRFLVALVHNRSGGAELLPAHLRALMIHDQVPAAAKTPESFFPGFWDGMGWGFGVGVQTTGPHAGRIGWSGGQGTDFFVDPNGTIGVLLTQVELSERMMPLLTEFQEIPAG